MSPWFQTHPFKQGRKRKKQLQVMASMHRLLRFALEQDPGRAETPREGLILFIVRLAIRVESYGRLVVEQRHRVGKRQVDAKQQSLEGMLGRVWKNNQQTYSLFFKLPNNLVNFATTARTLQKFWHGPLGHEQSKATYLVLWYCGSTPRLFVNVKNVPLSSWMHQLQDPKRSGWNDSSAAPRDFAYAFGMGFAGWGNRLRVQELRYYEFIHMIFKFV